MKTLAVAVSLVLAGCAPPMGAADAPQRAGAARQCFFTSNVNGYREAGDEAVHLRVGAKEIWRLEFLGRCPGVEWTMGRIGLQQRGGGSTICSGHDVDVLIDDSSIPRRCPVKAVRRLSETEVAALPPAQRP